MQLGAAVAHPFSLPSRIPLCASTTVDLYIFLPSGHLGCFQFGIIMN